MVRKNVGRRSDLGRCFARSKLFLNFLRNSKNKLARGHSFSNSLPKKSFFDFSRERAGRERKAKSCLAFPSFPFDADRRSKNATVGRKDDSHFRRIHFAITLFPLPTAQHVWRRKCKSKGRRWAGGMKEYEKWLESCSTRLHHRTNQGNRKTVLSRLVFWPAVRRHSGT